MTHLLRPGRIYDWNGGFVLTPYIDERGVIWHREVEHRHPERWREFCHVPWPDEVILDKQFERASAALRQLAAA